MGGGIGMGCTFSLRGVCHLHLKSQGKLEKSLTKTLKDAKFACFFTMLPRKRLTRFHLVARAAAVA